MLQSFKFVLLLLLGGVFTVAYADVGQDTVVSAAQQEDMLADPEKDAGHSVAPLVGYEPTFGFVFGGAYFYSAPRISFGTDVNTNFKQVYQLHSHFINRPAMRWEYGLKLGITQGYDPFYGQGGETKPGDFARLWGVNSSNRIHMAYKPTSILSLGAFVDGRIRTERAGDGSPKAGRQFPDETSFSLGIFQKIDTRDRREDPKEGFVFGTEVSLAPGAMSSVAGRPSFTQLSGDFIVYKEILNGVIPDVIAAFQVMGGTTFGQPGYLYNYRLGGANALRGYLENRFRGKKYYMQQTELRFPVLQPLSAAGFIGFGDITDDSFTNPKMAYGVGIRIGLPPDYVSKIRIDMGFGRDQTGVFANFGQTF